MRNKFRNRIKLESFPVKLDPGWVINDWTKKSGQMNSASGGGEGQRDWA